MKKIVLREQELWLLPQRAIFWKEQKVLLPADLHLGKAAPFQRAGIAVPNGVSKRNFDILNQLMDHWQPEQVYFLGDLFHSSHNITMLVWTSSSKR